ncbi:permease [bacterium]|nr:permease [bacterium]
MNKDELKKLSVMIIVFVAAYFLPLDWSRFQNGLTESLAMTRDYAREHVLLCLVPALFIAGAISVFVSQASVLKYFGSQARKVVAYGVASVSGSVLAVCSCTVLPLFSGIYTRGSGLGPATTFLYSGPAINVLAIILTARVLGLKMGIARAFGALFIAIIIGLLMQFTFRKEERDRHNGSMVVPGELETSRPLWKDSLYFFSMVGLLVFMNWGKPLETTGIWAVIFNAKWTISSLFGLLLLFCLYAWFRKEELSEWVVATWDFAKQIIPLLFFGVLIAGFLLGRPGKPALIPEEWIAHVVGGNSIGANFFAAIVGAFMYFATLTEVPILQGLLGAGMGSGPALALLLAGPALSLPSMLVINSVLGVKKTVVYVAYVVVFSTLAGLLYGVIA